MRNGYIEVTENHDLDVWVQWLNDDGTARDLTDWTAYLDIEQTPTIEVLPAAEKDAATSAFRFRVLSDSQKLQVGLWEAKVKAVDSLGADDSAIVIARLKVNVYSERPV